MSTHPIKLLVSDVDGVLTDGRLFFTDQGELGKAFHVHDGQGIKCLQESGIVFAVISARQSKAVALRLSELNVKHTYLGEKNKLDRLEALCAELNCSKKEVAYIGDDLADIACMQAVGLAIAPANAVDAIKAIAHRQTEKSGGYGAVREACDYILKMRSAHPNEHRIEV